MPHPAYGAYCILCGSCMSCYGGLPCPMSDDGRHVCPHPTWWDITATDDLPGFVREICSVCSEQRVRFVEVPDGEDR